MNLPAANSGGSTGSTQPPPTAEFYLVLPDSSCSPATAANCKIVMKQVRSEARKQAKAKCLAKAAEIQMTLEDRRATRELMKELAELNRSTIRWAARFKIKVRPEKPTSQTSPVVKRITGMPMKRHAGTNDGTMFASSWVVDDRGMRGVIWQQSYLGRQSPAFYRGACCAKWEYDVRDEAVMLDAQGEPVIITNMGGDWAEVGAAWQAIEDASTRKNAKIQIGVIAPFDADMSDEEKIDALRHFCKTVLEPLELPYSAVIHHPSKHGDQRNAHPHLRFSLRPFRRIEAYCFDIADEVRGELDGKDGVQMLRHLWAHSMSAAAEQAGSNRAYTGLGYAARGLPLEAGEHLGEARSAMVTRGKTVAAHERNLIKNARNAARMKRRDFERKIAALTKLRDTVVSDQANVPLIGRRGSIVIGSATNGDRAKHRPSVKPQPRPSRARASFPRMSGAAIRTTALSAGRGFGPPSAMKAFHASLYSRRPPLVVPSGRTPPAHNSVIASAESPNPWEATLAASSSDDAEKISSLLVSITPPTKQQPVTLASSSDTATRLAKPLVACDGERAMPRVSLTVSRREPRYEPRAMSGRGVARPRRAAKPVEPPDPIVSSDATASDHHEARRWLAEFLDWLEKARVAEQEAASKEAAEKEAAAERVEQERVADLDEPAVASFSTELPAEVVATHAATEEASNAAAVSAAARPQGTEPTRMGERADGAASSVRSAERQRLSRRSPYRSKWATRDDAILTIGQIPNRSWFESNPLTVFSVRPAVHRDAEQDQRLALIVEYDLYVEDMRDGRLGLSYESRAQLKVDDEWQASPDVQHKLTALRADQQVIMAILETEAQDRPLKFATSGDRPWPRDLDAALLARLDRWSSDPGFENESFPVRQAISKAHADHARVERQRIGPKIDARDQPVPIQPIEDGFGGQRTTPAPTFRLDGSLPVRLVAYTANGKPTDQLLEILRFAADRPYDLELASDKQIMTRPEAPQQISALIMMWRDDPSISKLIVTTVTASRAAGKPVYPPALASAIRKYTIREAGPSFPPRDWTEGISR